MKYFNTVPLSKKQETFLKECGFSRATQAKDCTTIITPFGVLWTHFPALTTVVVLNDADFEVPSTVKKTTFENLTI